MPSQQVSVLEVLITADATAIRVGMAQATAATEEFAAATKTAGATQATAAASSVASGRLISQAFTLAKLGALAFAASSVKAAIDFNRQMAQIAAITNTTQDRIAGLTTTIMNLSSQTGTAPIELAHAMYFLASAGLDVNQQMTALDAVARGVAVGLGDAGDLARITANALNVFADNGLTATQVMDTLTAAIREGTAEPDEFATALGRVLPIADQAGISFQSVAASLAAMSNAGLDVNEGVTSLRAILQSLVAPTAQTESAFHTMGLTVDEVVASMQGQGLIATLRLLQEHAKAATNSTGDFNQLMRHAIPNIRGLAGAFNLLKQNSDKIDQIFQAVARSAGALDRAFEITSQSDAFKVKQALNEISISGQKLAAVVLPALATGLQAVGNVTQGFANDIEGVKHLNFASYLNAIALPLRVMTFGKFPRLVTPQDLASTQNQIDQVQLMLASGSIAIDKQAEIWQQALDSVGGQVTPANVDDFTNAIRAAITSQELADQTAQNQAKSQIAAAAATKTFTYETNQAQKALVLLSNAGIDSKTYLSDLYDTLSQSDDAAKDFGTAVDSLTQSWNSFHDQAVQALSFAPKALDDLTSSAQSAQDQLDSMTQSSSITGSALSDLQNTANVTGADILSAIQGANQETADFGHNLLEIAKVGGSAGKALAASLLQSGNVMAAQVIANSPLKLQKQITTSFGKGADMADTLATKLTNSIVGPLNSIVHILTKLAENVWKIDVNGDGVIGVGKQVDQTKHKTHKLVDPRYKLNVALQDAVSTPLTGIQGDVDHLTGHHYNVKLGLDPTPAETQLHNFDTNLDHFLDKKRQIDIGVHLHGNSPMPDEAMKMHFETPLREMGFTKIGNVWTTALDIGAHTDPSTFPGGSAPKDAKDAQRKAAAGLGDLKKVEMRQLQVLFDIRHELRGGPGGGSGGSGSSSGTSSSGSSGSSGSGASSDFSKQLTQQLRDMRIYVDSVQGKKAANKWASAIQDAIQNGDMTKEIKLLHQAMRDMADTTGPKEAQKAFHEFQDSVKQFEKMQHQAQFKQFMADALAYATHNVPRLPKGHTNISVNHHEHNRRREVTLDRKRFTQSAGYEVDYARGF